MDSIIIYELLLPVIIKVFESETFYKDLSFESLLKRSDSHDNILLNNNEANRPQLKQKKRILEKEDTQKISEANKMYLMMMVTFFF